MATISLSDFTPAGSKSNWSNYQIAFINKVDKGEEWHLGANGKMGTVIVGFSNKSENKRFVDNLKTDFIGAMNAFKSGNSILLPTISGPNQRLSNLWREDLKSKKGVGGDIQKKDVEILSETMFCIYFSIWLRGNKSQYSPTIWGGIKTASQVRVILTKLGIIQNCGKCLTDKEFLQRIDKIDIFLNDKGWHDRLVSQQEKFFSDYSFVGTNYYIMRADVIPALHDPYKVYEVCAQKAKVAFDFRSPTDKDKWNPSDVWIFTPESLGILKKMVARLNSLNSLTPNYVHGYLNRMNSLIYQLYRKRTLFPISLKAPGGTVHISEENSKKSSYYKVVHYTGVTYINGNQDSKINFRVDLVDKSTNTVTKRNYFVGKIKTKLIDSGGARLEIEADSGTARFGSAGTENYGFIIRETDITGINELKRIRNKDKYKDIKQFFPTGNNWVGGLSYNKDYKSKKINEIHYNLFLEYCNELFAKVTGDSGAKFDPEMISGVSSGKTTELEALLNKVHAGEVALAVSGIVSRLKKDIVVENIYDLLASQRYSAGVRPEQLERRLKAYENEFKEEIESLPPQIAKVVYESCFHLKIY